MRRNSSQGTPLGYSYVRFSTPEQLKGDSLRRQTEAAAAWCQRNKVQLNTNTTYADLGKSAYLGAHRQNPDRHRLAAFLKLVEDGRIPRGSFLIVENLDRLTREHVRAAVTLFLSILEQGVSIVTTSPERVFRHDSQDMTDVIIAVVELSRGHGESKRKSDMVGAAWREKKKCAREGKPQPLRREARVNGMALVTHCLPAWIEERGGKPVLIPAKAAIVRRIFQLAAHGYGSKLIVRKFNAQNVPPIGRADHWNASYVRSILLDRRAVGEYQPKQKRGRVKDGAPIPDYFPPAVSPEEWLAARALIEQRRSKPGGMNKYVNTFSGLLKNARGGDSFNATVRHTKGYPPQRIIINNAAREGYGAAYTFPYAILEQAILECLREIDPHEILNGDSGPDESLVLAGELARVEAKIAELEAELLIGEVASLAKVLRQLEGQRNELAEKLAKAQQTAAFPLSECWGEVQSLAEALETARDPEDARLRLRAVLRRIVDTVWLCVVPRGFTRLCAAQIWFAGGKRNRAYLIYYQAQKSNGKARQDMRLSVSSLADVGKLPKLDLRNEEDTEALVRVLTEIDLAKLQ